MFVEFTDVCGEKVLINKNKIHAVYKYGDFNYIETEYYNMGNFLKVKEGYKEIYEKLNK